MKESNYDKTALFFVKTLKGQKHLYHWDDAVQAYEKISNQDITPEELQKEIKKIKVKDIDQSRFNELTKNYTKYIPKKKEELSADETELTVLKPKAEDSNIVHLASIPIDDFGPVFGILSTDDNTEKIRKIKLKFADDNFFLRYNGYDPNKVYIDKRIPCAWNTSMKVKQEDGKDKVYMVINESDRVIIKTRKNPIFVDDEYNRNLMLEDLKEFLSKHLITPYDIFAENNKKKETDLDENLCMVCPGLELHLGKLGAKEDYENYSSKQALWRVKYLAQEMYKYQEKNKAGTLVIGVGNDFYNSDTLDDKTPAGTQQNNDTRYKSMYLWGVVSYMSLIETMRPYFNHIVLKFNPGNHDEKSAFSLYTQLYMEYADKNDKTVTASGDEKLAPVEVGMSYPDIHFNTAYQFGNSNLIFAHSKTPNSKYFDNKKLAQLAMYSFPEEYHKFKYTYIFAGHIHQDGEETIKNTNVTIFRTPSLGGHGSWDAENAYLNAREGHTLYLIDKDNGFMGKQYVTINNKDKDKKVNSLNTYEPDLLKNMKSTLNINSEATEVKDCKERIDKLSSRINSKKTRYEDIVQKIIKCSNGEEIDDNKMNELLTYMGYDDEVAEDKDHLEQSQNVLQKMYTKTKK